MGVSFKVAKAGTRYRPKPLQIEEKDNENGSVTEFQQTTNEVVMCAFSICGFRQPDLSLHCLVFCRLRGFFHLIVVLVFLLAFEVL